MGIWPKCVHVYVLLLSILANHTVVCVAQVDVWVNNAGYSGSYQPLTAASADQVTQVWLHRPAKLLISVISHMVHTCLHTSRMVAACLRFH